MEVTYNEIYEVIMDSLDRDGYLVTFPVDDRSEDEYYFDGKDWLTSCDYEYEFENIFDAIWNIAKEKRLKKFVFAPSNVQFCDGLYIYCTSRKKAVKAVIDLGWCDEQGYGYSRNYINSYLYLQDGWEKEY